MSLEKTRREKTVAASEAGVISLRTPEARMSPPGEKRATFTVLRCPQRVSMCSTAGWPSASRPRLHSCGAWEC